MTALHSSDAGVAIAVAEEDVVRARVYRLLARVLARPADGGELERLASLEGDETELGAGISTLARLAARMSPDEISREYHDLFIGLGRGELVPYGSYYLTGFLHEKPLARLRGAMGELGIARDPAVKEPEDHVAALMDMMAGLILGEFGEPAGLDVQRAFYRDHVGNWAGHFYRDLEGARVAVFHAPVGRIGRVFMEIEDAAFAMD